MWKCAVVAYAVSVSSSVALAGAIIDVVPLSSPPYAGGQRVEVEIRLTQQSGGQDTYLRAVQIVFAETDPALGLDETFTFDYSAQAACVADPSRCGADHAEFTHLTQDLPYWQEVPVATVYTGLSRDPAMQIRLPAAGRIPIGTIGVTLPTQPGDYLLDVMNANASDPRNFSAAIFFGFPPSEPFIVWQPTNGDELAGGRFTAITTADADVMFGYTPIRGAIVPEPMSLVLLAVGGLAILRRRVG